MPHPERACEPGLAGDDGLESIFGALEMKTAVKAA